MFEKRLVIAVLVLAIITVACGTTTAQAPATPDLAALQAAVQQTLDFQNTVNAQLTQAAPPPVQIPTTSPPTQQPPTIQSTSSVPMLTVSLDTNCREGPSAQIWKAIGAVVVGQKAEIVGVYTKGHWYIVKNPKNPNERCWVTDQYATVEGDTSLLPKIPVPPTPTPKP